MPSCALKLIELGLSNIIQSLLYFYFAIPLLLYKILITRKYLEKFIQRCQFSPQNLKKNSLTSIFPRFTSDPSPKIIVNVHLNSAINLSSVITMLLYEFFQHFAPPPQYGKVMIFWRIKRCAYKNIIKRS